MAITRTLLITYGAQTVPATGTGYTVDLVDIHRVSMDYRTLTLEFTVAIVGTGTDAQFATGLQALRAAFRTPNQDLTISMEGEEQFAGTVAGHTFMDSEASLAPLTEYQSARSHAFRVTIRGTLPADLSGQGGRFSANVRTSRSPQERRTVTVTAEYSGLGGTSAADHESTFDTWADALVGALTGTFEVSVPTSVQRDDFNTAATFSRTYAEILDAQSSEGTDDTRLVNTRYRVTVDNSAAEVARGSAGAPGRRVRVDFFTGIKASASESAALIAATVIVPFLESKAVLGGGGSNLRVVSQRVNVDLADKTASGFVDFAGFGSSLLLAAVDKTVNEANGRNLVPVLSKKDEFAADLHYGPAFRSLTVRIYTRELGLVPTHARRLEKAWIADMEREGWLHLNTQRPESERDLTQPNGFVTANFVESGAVLNFRWWPNGKRGSRRA